jgi:hypothetical protein
VWGLVPFYIRAESNPIVCLEIAKKISALLDIGFDLGDLKRSPTAFGDTGQADL